MRAGCDVCRQALFLCQIARNRNIQDAEVVLVGGKKLYAGRLDELRVEDIFPGFEIFDFIACLGKAVFVLEQEK